MVVFLPRVVARALLSSSLGLLCLVASLNLTALPGGGGVPEGVRFKSLSLSSGESTNFEGAKSLWLLDPAKNKDYKKKQPFLALETEPVTILVPEGQGRTGSPRAPVI